MGVLDSMDAGLKSLGVELGFTCDGCKDSGFRA